MVEFTAILLTGIVASVFVAFNIGGSSTGIAWGPAVGAGLISKTAAAGVMTVFVFLGGWTVGRNVIDTLAGDIVTTPISVEAGVAVLFFVGLGILIANVFGVPVPTSMTTVGSIAGLGLASGTLDFETIGWIVSWWIMSPFLGFWIGVLIGRHFYSELNRRFEIVSTEGPLLVLDRNGTIPTPALGPNTTYRELVGTVAVVVIGCYMAFSAGASNVRNAVAPLVGEGGLDVDTAIVVATLAIGIGGFTIARRTMESVGTELTDIPLFAALIVMVVAASITTFLSYLGVPISLVLASVMTIVGLGWGRATRPITLEDAVRGSVRGRIDAEISTGVLTSEPTDTVTKIGEAEPDEVLEAGELFDRTVIVRYVSMWIVGPTVSLALSYAFFVVVPLGE